MPMCFNETVFVTTFKHSCKTFSNLLRAKSMQRKQPPTLQDVEGHRVASSHGLLWGKMSGEKKGKDSILMPRAKKRHFSEVLSCQLNWTACRQVGKSKYERFVCPLNFGHPLLGLLCLILHMPILMNLSFLSTLTIGLYFIHAAHRHQKKKLSRGYLIWGLVRKNFVKTYVPPLVLVKMFVGN